MLKALGVLVVGAFLSSTATYAAGIEVLKGKWISSIPLAGQAVDFPKHLGDYSTLLPGFQTLASIGDIVGHNGAEIKVVSQLGLVCYYSIALSRDDMTWSQRDGGSNCPSTIALQRKR